MLGELALGRRSGKSGVSTYRALSKKYTWLGYAGVLCGFCKMCIRDRSWTALMTIS